MSVSKEKVFTMTAAFGIIKSAVQKVSKVDNATTDTIIFNSLNRAIARKKTNKKDN